MTERRGILLAIGFLLLLLFVELPGTSLFDPDEARYAEIPREMLAHHDFLTPTLNGAHYFEKPPLLYWLNAGSMKVFGENVFAVRLPTRLAALGTTFLIASFLSPAVAPWAALVYVSSPLPFSHGRINLTDGVLTFFLTLAFFCLWKLIQEADMRRRWKYEIGLGAGMGFAMLTKGLIALVLPGLVVFLWATVMARWRILPRLVFSWALPIFLAISVPWFILMERANPGFSKFFFIHEHFQRYATSVAHRQQPSYYFLGVFVLGFLPWISTFYRSLRSFFSRWSRSARLDGDGLYFFLWFAVIVLFFSLSQSKLIPYILPVFPAAAALAGRFLSTVDKKKQTQAIRWAWAWGLVYLGIIVALPAVARSYSDNQLATAAVKSGADQVVCYRTYSQSFPWVLKRPIPVVDFQGELASDGIKPDDLFWSGEEFWKAWYAGGRMAVCLRNGEEDEFRNTNSQDLHVLARNRESLVLVNFDPTVAGVSASRK